MKEKILIVDDDPDTLRLMGLMLQRHGFVISTANSGEQGLALALSEKPDLVVLDIMMPDMDGYEVARRLRKDPLTAQAPILMFTAKSQIDDKVVGYEAGADAYVTKPAHPTDLHTQVSALLQKVAERKADNSPSAAVHGKVIGILAVRGGLGASTVAANLAAALLARTKSRVILAELTPGQGTLGMELGAEGQQGLKELLQASPSEVSSERVQAALVLHPSGLRLLLASENPVDVNLTSRVENYASLLRQLSELAEYIVVDLGSGLPDSVQEALPFCQEHIVVLDGTPNTIRQGKILVHELRRLGIEAAAISVLLNSRARAEALMSRDAMQMELGHPISAALAADPELFQQAARAQIPAVLSQPNNLTSQQFMTIAESMMESRKPR